MMTNPVQHSVLTFARDLWEPALALTLVCALTMVATRPAQAQTFSVIHDFSGTDGYMPYAGVTLDAGGNLRGTTFQSLAAQGTAFELRRSQDSWLLRTLGSFQGVFGSYPASGVVFGPGGALFGTTSLGGLRGFGIVYNLRPPGSVCRSALCPWRETIIYQFVGGTDGAHPDVGNLVFDRAGNIYGTTGQGGAANQGTVYELTPSGGGWTEKVLYSFLGGNDGAQPFSGVILDAAGNLYGTTTGGGGSGCGGLGCGTVYQLTSTGSGWTENILYSFQAGATGENPYGGLIFDQAGNLYGTTLAGGSGGGGTVFELSPSGGSWGFTLLYGLSGNSGGSLGSLAMDGAGILYGTTFSDGIYSAGAVFKLTHQGGGWTYTTLHDFLGGDDGLEPIGGPTVDAQGNVYGTASEGGTQNCGFETNCGVIWEITP
jgi:uncharacterized repeat protein (TIGR03803 family)